mgnify:CR=1 FL=1
MYKIIYDSIDTTFNQIYKDDEYYNLLNSTNISVQSFTQKKGTGRGKKKWISPRGNIYITINQKCKSDEILKNSFYLCLLIHKFLLNNFSVKTQYKWPNDLYFNNKKIVGVVSKSKIISKYAYIQAGVGININNNPLDSSISLSKIISKKLSIYDVSNKLIIFLNKNLKKPSSNKIITKYLNRYLMSNFKLKHLNITNEKINILKVENDLSLLIDINNKKQNIFFGELI